MNRLSAYQKIIRAAKNGTGTRLTPDECHLLSIDPAIYEAAGEDDNDDRYGDVKTSDLCGDDGGGFAQIE